MATYFTRKCSSMFFLCVFLPGLLSTTSTTKAVVILPPNISVPAVIVFGDSIGDQGNNNNLNTLIKCNFSPYGNDFIGGLATGRFSNSKTPPDMLAEELGIKELVPAYLDPNLQIKDLPTGVSFASGGSGYDIQTPALASVLTLSEQLKLFKDYIRKLKILVGEKRTQYILRNSIHLVIAGTDDLAITYFSAGIGRLESDIDSYTNLLVDSASNFTKELHRLGAKRIGVFGVPPIGCLPSQRTLAGGVRRVCAKDQNEAAKLYNFKLSNKFDSIAKRLRRSKVLYIDLYNPLLDIIQYPQNYGLEVVDRGCCGTGNLEVAVLCNRLTPTCLNSSRFLFWDSFHPTETGYRVLVRRLIHENIRRFF